MNTEIIAKLKEISVSGKFPDDTDCSIVSVEGISDLATLFNIERRDVEIIALEEGVVPERYARNMKTFSLRDQVVLLKSAVSIVGLGGLGGAVSEILARTGVGTLNLIDGDSFEASNLNRQFFSTHEMMGKFKTEAAVKRIENINASITVRRHHEYIDDENAVGLIDPSNVIVDCLDNIKTRFILESASKRTGLPLVSAAVAGLSGHVTTIFPEDRGLELIYGPPDGLKKTKGAEMSLGCLSPAVTVLAAFETAEVVKVVLNKGSLLRNKLLVIDLMDNITQVLDLL